MFDELWANAGDWDDLLLCDIPADTKRCINGGLTLVQRRGRWTHVKPTLIQRVVFAGMALIFYYPSFYL